MSSFTHSLASSSSPLLSFREDKFSSNSSHPCLTSPLEEGVDPLEDYENTLIQTLGEAMDMFLKIKGTLTKEEMRHLTDVRRQKQVRERVIWEVQDRPLICSSSWLHKLSLTKLSEVEGGNASGARLKVGAHGCLRLRARHDKKEIESFKERIHVKGCKNRELEYKLKELEHKFEEGKALTESQAYKA
ncbi:hypothetical protein Cgig2_010649 [Carnegiea gigantea]|uniref:Uncharacterized protein n=1 Tax=Carnegiea gigantea TaxID=171969 RepID=A0A9Q1Q5Y4_9CARY|nr:hypothetical protein Cgig2_010649 [Carnegiea gigantea]